MLHLTTQVFVRVEIEADDVDVDLVNAVALDFVDALELRDRADGGATFVLWFPDADSALALRRQVSEVAPAAGVTLTPTVEKDWAEKWKESFPAVRTGRLWVGPPWLEEQAVGAQVAIVIPPSGAFGNGDHPSTFACLEFLERWMPAHRGASVLDVGTGSGVLAIVARRLGAGRVVGVDLDGPSIARAEQNARANGALGLELSTTPIAEVDGQFELVIANILDEHLAPLAEAIAPRVGGVLVLAGIRVSERARVEAAFAATGLLKLVATSTQTRPGHFNEWVRMEWVPLSGTRAARR